jgi:NAD(P)-dependent dehydrogenase (short-subunit alcohol dehydrogenase family)
MNILITGGSSGLGKSTVELLAPELQHNVWFTYLPDEKNESSVYFLKNKFKNVEAIAVDYCDIESVHKLCSLISRINLDVLVNNAYVGSPLSAHFHRIAAEDFLTGFSNNILPTILISQAAICTFMVKRFGKIINILTSAILTIPPSGSSIYVANKAYLLELSRVWNKEYARYNITSNCVSPEYMNTGFNKIDDRLVEQMIAEHPLKRLLTTTEVAGVIKFLIDATQQVNGVNIQVNASQK